MSYDNQNIFAKILREELPCIKVYEDEHTLAFMDIMPQSEGHTLVIPKVAAETLFELPASHYEACFNTLKKVGNALKKAFGTEGIMMFQLSGADAGQTVPHLHFHLLPTSIHTLRTSTHAAKMADQVILQGYADRIIAVME
ncbi:HIT family protein [Ketobacter alkanivorans]|uniref:HIT family protein n=1 Tax=Ketobacter alkanivorans TaxID=1917421 RepID=A0A2K9LRI0_9GAMM|nr:HIT domain-containing protein [Ketobacter alkanivorans]AUM14946.1 HIT family protein [Ketobacter alkanivorans]